MTIKRKLKYSFFIVAIVWFLITVYLIYQYLLFSSKEVVSKWWTFVEGIFDTTSFLPYLRSDEQSLFYQWMLFQSCLKQVYTGWNLLFEDDVCHVTSSDYQTYYISLLSWTIWSDWVPMSLEDVFFTYNDILKHNVWWIPTLNKYEQIEISQTEDGKVKVFFPESSTDNNVFFTNYILPRHALFDTKLDEYQKSFSIEPVYTNCAHIMPQNTDQYSLIFDLSNCPNSPLWFYQIKNTVSFKDFVDTVNLNWSIVDAYFGDQQVSWYNKVNLTTNKVTMVFFNTNSQKTRVRLRRALWWFIKENFYTGNYSEYIQKYDNSIFNNFVSTGDNIHDFLKRSASNEILTKGDLQDVWIKELPSELFLSGENRKLVYFAESIVSRYTLTIRFDEAFSKMSIVHNDWAEYSPQSYVSTKKEWKYNIWPSLGNLVPWINKYKIYAYSKNEKKLIATLDLYNLKWEISKNVLSTWEIIIWSWHNEEDNLTVIYYKSPISKFVVSQLQKIFAEENLLEFFSFVWFDDLEEFDWKLINWDYDIVINTVNMWFKQDISKIIISDNPKINHSQYQNTRIIPLLKQYFSAKDWQKESITDQINSIYGTDMPFIMLWFEYSNLYIKPKVLSKLDNKQVLSENNWRNEIYKKLNLVETINIDFKNAWNIRDFLNFIFDIL